MEAASDEFRLKVDGRAIDERHRYGIYIDVRWPYAWMGEMAGVAESIGRRSTRGMDRREGRARTSRLVAALERDVVCIGTRGSLQTPRPHGERRLGCLRAWRWRATAARCEEMPYTN